MAEQSQAGTAPIEAVQQRIAELFMRVCADPDDAVVAVAADRALHELDEFLAARNR